MKILIAALLTIGAVTSCFAQQTFYDIIPGNGNGVRFWQDNTYKIHMGYGAEYLYGPVTDYSIKTNMSNDAGRGWVWGVTGATPVAAINTQGNMQIAGTFTANKLQVFAENTFFGIDAQTNARLGFIKKFGGFPVIASDNISPIIFAQTNQNGVNTNISGATVTERMRVDVTGNVGIGTASPRGKFDVDGPGDVYLSDDVIAGAAQSLYIPGQIFISPYNGSNISYLQARRSDNSGTTSLRLRTCLNGTLNESMHIEGNGNIGIGTITPAYKLDVSGPINATALNVNGQPFLGTQWTTAGTTISYNGNVGIGTPLTSNPNGYTLAVNGIIGAKDMHVEKSSATWPDYVFEKNYDLPSLTELENYIQKNKHLENVPSAEEVKENGYSMTEMDAILLKKVEELSLYVIQQQKEINELKTQLEKKGRKK